MAGLVVMDASIIPCLQSLRRHRHLRMTLPSSTYTHPETFLSGVLGKRRRRVQERVRWFILNRHALQGLLLFDIAGLRPGPGMPPAIVLMLPPAMVMAHNRADPVRNVAEYDPGTDAAWRAAPPRMAGVVQARSY
ncbi:hypothetical protein CH063_08413 [Colletotrichum higginsianum]|uniref:Uncharacterized protein n=2 Tax=Colletotrichum higginsianum (strain IMI 349063) TaxID=759273 RepID=H1V9S1_COLHI|nr:hypothetical protein CH063_08413 [Colletotrichum higginsianum]